MKGKLVNTSTMEYLKEFSTREGMKYTKDVNAAQVFDTNSPIDRNFVNTFIGMYKDFVLVEEVEYWR